MTRDNLIYDRMSAGREFLGPRARRYNRNVNRYLGRDDYTGTRASGGNEFRRTPVGEVNYLAINIRQKTAALAIHNPDWRVVSDNPEDAEIVRQYLRRVFDERSVPRIGRRCLLQRALAMQGFCFYIWTDKGFTPEFCKIEDILIDPNVTDETWNTPRWAFRRVRLPIREAIARYGKEALSVQLDDDDEDAYETRRTNGIEVWQYWDAETEVEMLEGSGRYEGDRNVLRKSDNLYGGVPLAVLQGDHDPDSEWSLSDYDTSYGIWKMLQKLQNIFNNHAQNGGGVPWIRGDYIDPEMLEQYLNGEIDGPISVRGAPGDDVVGYTPNQAINPALLPALQYVQNGLFSDQAVTGYDLGQTQNVQYATEAALIQTRSTARSQQARLDYEKFLRRLGMECLRLTREFGLDPRMQPDETAIRLYLAIGNVKEIYVVEESASYKDPAREQQAAMQLLTIALQAFPTTLQIGQPLNLQAFFDDALRTFNRQHLDKYWLAPNDAQALMHTLQQQAQAAQPQQTEQRSKQPQETLTYKDAPPDVRRQIEAAAGLQPSEQPEISEKEIEILKMQDQAIKDREEMRYNRDVEGAKLVTARAGRNKNGGRE